MRTGLSKLAAVSLALSMLCTPVAAQPYGNPDAPIRSVTQLDLHRYAGRWYEIARFPNRFERGCVAVTADYALTEDGQISVTNTCRQGGFDGEVDVAEGRARVEAPGQLSVNFVWFLPFIRGDYWVLHIAEDYSLAVVGEPGRDYGWVLSRTPQIAPARYAQALEVLTDNGYDVSQIALVPQP